MKKILSTVLIALISSAALIAVYHFYLNSTSKIGVVDSNRLIAEYKGTKAALTEFEEKSKVWRANLDTLTVEFQNELKKFEKERGSMTEKEIQLSQELLRNKQNQIGQYQQVTEEKIQKEDQEVSQKLYSYINQVVNTYGTKNNYQIILGAKGDGGVLYGEDAIDITDELIEILNGIE